MQGIIRQWLLIAAALALLTALGAVCGAKDDRYALNPVQQPGVTSPIIGPRTMAQLEDNLGSADVTITDEDRARIDAVNPPGWTVTPYYELLRRPHQYRVL